MKDYTTRVELMAIPIVASCSSESASSSCSPRAAGPWAWLLLGVAGLVLVGLLIWIYARRNLIRRGDAAPAAVAAAPDAAADGVYRVLVIADESCIDPAFAGEIAGHAGGRYGRGARDRTRDRLLALPLDGDESAHADARRHLDDTVTALARAGITARGQTGADDPLQAADDGLREFAADEIVFVTKPGTNTDWVEKGVVEDGAGAVPAPVTHIALPAG